MATGRLDGLDLSFSAPNFPAFKSAGIKVVMRYLSHTPSKNWSAAQILSAHSNSIGVVFGWETTAGRALDGSAAGASDARESVAQIRALINSVGYSPANKVVVYFAVDFDTTSGQYAALDAYFKAARDVLHAEGYLCGVYGEADVIEHLHAKGLTDAEWQTYAWSGGRVSSEADFYQYLNGQTLGGATVDFNQIMHESELGAWWPRGSALNLDEENPLSNLTDKQLDQIADAVTAKVWAHRYTRPEDKVNRSMEAFIAAAAYNGAVSYATAKSAKDALGAKLDTVAKVLTADGTGVLSRVASTQAKVDKLATTVAALQKSVSAIPTSAAAITVDAAHIAATTATSVVTKLKALSWKAV